MSLVFAFVFLSTVQLMYNSNPVLFPTSVAENGTAVSQNCDKCTVNSEVYKEYTRNHDIIPPVHANLVLSYFSGKLDVNLFNIFVRSLRSTGCKATVVVMIHGFVPTKQAQTVAEVYDVQLLPVHPSLMKDIPWSNDGAVFRFRAWNRFLQENQHKFCHVLNADMDVYFQSDPFICFFGPKCITNSSILHSFAENPALRIGDCPTHTNWYVNDCGKMDGPKYFTLHREKMRICSGFSIGTVHAYLIYLAKMEAFIFQTDGKCNDQPIHNILIWGNLLSDIRSVHVWDYFLGPVKTIDAGYIQDEFGRIINDHGLPYCVVHQFKEDRNGFFVEGLKHQFPLHGEARRVHHEDTRFPNCTHEECKGRQVHSSVNLMIQQNIVGGWRGTLPSVRRILQPIGPVPNLTDPHGYTLLQ